MATHAHGNIMLDLETMSSAPNAAIIAIGAVAFDPELLWNDCVVSEFYVNVDLEDSARLGGHISASTVTWWLQQSQAARVALKADKQHLVHALHLFGDWIQQVNGGLVTGLWGNGVDFDNVVLRGAYERVEATTHGEAMKAPWSFRSNRCYRTFRAVHGMGVEPPPQEGESHNALDDARWQAKFLVRMAQDKGVKLP